MFPSLPTSAPAPVTGKAQVLLAHLRAAGYTCSSLGPANPPGCLSFCNFCCILSFLGVELVFHLLQRVRNWVRFVTDLPEGDDLLLEPQGHELTHLPSVEKK